MVLWDDIDKLPVSSRGLRYTLNALHRRLELHLGLHFHRFIQHGVLSIRIDQQEQGELEHQIRATVPALDPFGYSDAPLEGYPRTFLMRLAGVGEIPLECHIWPPNSDQPEYRLGNRAAARQASLHALAYRQHSGSSIQRSVDFTPAHPPYRPGAVFFYESLIQRVKDAERPH